MKKIYVFSFFLFISIISCDSFAELQSNTLTPKINEILSEFKENLNIGIFIQDAKSGEILYAKNSDRYFTPASNQKLFTAFAALQFLGAKFSYQTNLYVNPIKIRQAVLNDNLYLQFSGDPTLTIEQLDKLIHTLSIMGVHRIRGQIIVDDTAFDQESMSPGTAWDDQDFCWGSPVNALMINHNCVSAAILPAKLVGQKAKLELPAYPQSMQFINHVQTKPANANNCTIKVKRNNKSTYTINGCTKLGHGPYLIQMAIDNPRKNIETLLNYLFKKNQILSSETILFKKINITSKPIASVYSPPLKNMIAIMLKDSDNTIANALFKTVGALYTHKEGSFTNGSKAVRDIVTNLTQITIPKTTFIDGAGASRYNFLTPAQISSLLQKIFQSTNAADFISSLAISGIDGTLKNRMREPEIKGKIYAKTGSETAVTSLAGFVETKDKRLLIFSIMINGFTGPMLKYKTLEDKLCRVLVNS